MKEIIIQYQNDINNNQSYQFHSERKHYRSFINELNNDINDNINDIKTRGDMERFFNESDDKHQGIIKVVYPFFVLFFVCIFIVADLYDLNHNIKEIIPNIIYIVSVSIVCGVIYGIMVYGFITDASLKGLKIYKYYSSPYYKSMSLNNYINLIKSMNNIQIEVTCESYHYEYIVNDVNNHRIEQYVNEYDKYSDILVEEEYFDIKKFKKIITHQETVKINVSNVIDESNDLLHSNLFKVADSGCCGISLFNKFIAIQFKYLYKFDKSSQQYINTIKDKLTAQHKSKDNLFKIHLNTILPSNLNIKSIENEYMIFNLDPYSNNINNSIPNYKTKLISELLLFGYPYQLYLNSALYLSAFKFKKTIYIKQN